MKTSDALEGVSLLGVDTAPFIYFVEHKASHIDRVRVIFRLVDEGKFVSVTSVVTLTEVLNKPIKHQDTATEKSYRDMLLHSRYIILVPISIQIAERAAELRARYNLKTPDALQVATAIDAGCDAFLTNDMGLKRVTEIRVLILDELELDMP